MAGAAGTKATVRNEDQHISAQLRDVESRLVAAHSGGTTQGEDKVRRTLATIEARFTDARVRTFVPILVERAARAELNPLPGRH